MKFAGFKGFKSGGQTTQQSVIDYLSKDLMNALRDLAVGLKRLTFSENFESFEAALIIPAGVEIEVRNQLGETIPSRRMIVRGDSHSVVDGSTKWTKDFLYLKNTGSTTANVTVLFLK